MPSKIQFLGLEIDTTPDDYSDNYLGSQNGFNTDINGRCKILQNAIAQAAKKSSKDTNTLKLFMAPEFFFRSNDGGYPIEYVSKIMEKMRSYTKHPMFGKWIFVFGTAIGYLKERDKIEVFNVAMVQKGAISVTTGIESELIVYKEYVSHIDFIRNDALDWSVLSDRLVSIAGGSKQILATQGSRDVGSSRLKKTKPVGPGREQTITGLGGQGIFTMDSITFGLEVCLDHAKGRLLASPPITGQNKIQVHLVPSAGMSLETKYSVCMQGGYFFNVDGVEARADALIRKNGDIYNMVKQQIIMPLTVDTQKYFQSPGAVKIFAPQILPNAQIVA